MIDLQLAPMDCTIVIWERIFPEIKTNILVGYLTGVKSIIKLNNKETLVSGDNIGQTLRFWNLISYENETVINGIDCLREHSLLQIDEQRIIVGGCGVLNIINLYKIYDFGNFLSQKNFIDV